MATAREPASSSASTNGHPRPPAAALVPGTDREDTDADFDFDASNERPNYPESHPDASLYPSGKRSLADIGLQAFWLGFSLAASLIVGPYCTWHGLAIWRLFAFLASLSVFHFLEYWTTARFNVPAAQASSFLLFSNGVAYNVAHMLATVEILASALLLPAYRRWMTNAWTVGLGFVLVLLGQTVRSVAMAQAGTNFNHTPQKVRKKGHVLVTRGVYGLLRHPSYFGFFWWALGTQLLVGNKVCVVGYGIVLWRFFSKRIGGESREVMLSLASLTEHSQLRRGHSWIFSARTIRSSRPEPLPAFLSSNSTVTFSTLHEEARAREGACFGISSC